MQRLNILDHIKLVKKKNVNSKKDDQDEQDFLSDQTLLKKKQAVFQDYESSKKKIKTQVSPDICEKTQKFYELIKQNQERTELSQKTIDLINKVKIKHGIRSQKICQKDEVSELRKKLQQKILEKSKEKILSIDPIKRQLYQLKDIVSEIDQLINLFQIRQKRCYLEKVINILNSTLSDEVTIENIKQILFIAPELYNIYWYKGYNKQKYNLVIEVQQENNNNECFPFLKKQDCQKRLNFFEQEGKKFQESVSIDKKFTKIPQVNIPEKPDQIKGKRVKEIIIEINNKQEKQKIQNEISILQKLKLNGVLNKNQLLDQPLTNKEKVNLLRQQLLRKVYTKQYELEIKNCTNKDNLCKEDLIEISKRIHLHYSLRRVENMFLVAVIDYLQKHYPKQLTQDECYKYLVRIQEVYPEWIYEVENQSGKILRMNRNISLENIIKKFKQFQKIYIQRRSKKQRKNYKILQKF